jgi:N-acetylglucosaminyl-diphospho-decaprenol L-rhamnosyltransferase
MALISERITLSIVSHGQAYLVRDLLSDLSGLSKKNFEVIITINCPEDESIYHGFSFPLCIIHNDIPRGFGANHNAAFSLSTTKWFAVVNPDIRINSIDFQVLLAPFENPAVAAVAPVVLSSIGGIEDSARRFPTLMRFAKRVLFRWRNSDYKHDATPFPVDWVAGMFVVFRRDAYQEIGGFDDRRFFMYLEDADICRRISLKGWQVIVNPNSKVVHMAQRASRRNLKHMRWHVISAFRYLTGF